MGINFLRQGFSLFQSPIDLAHNYWKQMLRPGDHAIDATCGNGNDTLALSQMLLTCSDQSILIGIDIQQEALNRTHSLLEAHLEEKQRNRVFLFKQSHAAFPQLAYQVPIHLIVYNLGYLPKADKSITTMTETTLESIQAALSLVRPGGAISCTCYPGHEEGMREQSALLSFARTLDASLWSASFHSWPNRTASPALLFLQKCHLS